MSWGFHVHTAKFSGTYTHIFVWRELMLKIMIPKPKGL